MKTLVYFASGPIRAEYQDLDFDKIYLIDNCFRNRQRNTSKVFSEGKITCVGMDCLESIEFLKKEEVKIDCFVSLNEGLYEGGGSYAINSDMFLGYAMPIFKKSYIHIMNKNYYHHMYHVSMDLPYTIEEIKEAESSYLSPNIFSKDEYHKEYAKVFQMDRLIPKNIEISLNPTIKLKIIHDSIWNYYDNLDALIISFSEQGQRDFFDKIPKVLNKNAIKLDDIFDFCKRNKIQKIGFTPWRAGNYRDFLSKFKKQKVEYPNEILLFHLNKTDYKEIKEYASIRLDG